MKAARIVMLTMSAVAASGFSVPAHSAETKTYTYDVLGRVITVRNTGTVNNNQTRSYCYDAVGNRVEYDSTSSGTPDACVEQG